jgi:ectoine hydroxylase-related dioxygenase (phytanoyl-CoA dioxygenase family)
MNITKQQKENFTKEGFLIVPDFLTTDELETVREICDNSIQQVEEEMKKKNIKEDRINVLGKKYFIKDVRNKHPEMKKIIFSEKTAEVCKATIGETAYLHNEQFVVKMTDKSSSFAWHQDSGYSVYQGGAAKHKPYLTCWVALDDMSEENGTISVLPFSRSPSRELIEHKWDSDANAMVGYKGPDEGDFVKVKAGSLVAFSSFLLHKSGANITDRPRRSFFMAFTPELFTYADNPEKIYSSGEPLIIKSEQKI